MLVVDEASLMDQEYFYVSIFPLLQMKKATLIMISTPGGDECALNKFMEKRERYDPSIPCFLSVYIETVCAYCIKHGKELECTHVYRPPEWKDPYKIESIIPLYENFFVAKKELQGIAASTPGVFSLSSIKNFVENIYIFENKECFNNIYIGIDLGGMGDSETAIVSVVHAPSVSQHSTESERDYDKGVILLGANSFVTRDKFHISQELTSHIEMIKSMPYYNKRTTKIIVIPEIFGGGTMMIKEICQKIPEIYLCFTKGKNEDDDKCGLWTNEEIKHTAVLDLETMLLKNKAFISEYFFTTSYQGTEQTLAKNMIIDHLYKQLINFKKQQRVTAYGKISTVLTGKNTKGGGKTDSFKKDDIAMALLISIYWMNYLWVKNDKVTIKKSSEIKIPLINYYKNY